MLLPPCSAQQPAESDSDCVKKVDKLIRYAQSFIGVSYVWGANGPDSFDCSGFACYVYAKMGITLPRNSKWQSEAGERRSIRNVRKGDLVFFASGVPPDRDITHVGVVISDYENGNFRFIHANKGSGCVSISEFKEPAFKHSLVGVRNVLLCY